MCPSRLRVYVWEHGGEIKRMWAGGPVTHADYVRTDSSEYWEVRWESGRRCRYDAVEFVKLKPGERIPTG